MTDHEVERELAALDIARDWLTLGVLTVDQLDPHGAYRSSARRGHPFGEDLVGHELVEHALSAYLHDRTALDDAVLHPLLTLAAGVSEHCSTMIADWQDLSVAQLSQVAVHRGAPAKIRALAGQKLQFLMLADPEAPEVELIGVASARDEDPDWFHVRGFRFMEAWRRPLSAVERQRVALLIADLPRAMTMKCHMPKFGLIIANTRGETRITICFRCNNIFFNGGGTMSFEGRSAAAAELLAEFRALAPATAGNE